MRLLSPQFAGSCRHDYALFQPVPEQAPLSHMLPASGSGPSAAHASLPAQQLVSYSPRHCGEGVEGGGLLLTETMRNKWMRCAASVCWCLPVEAVTMFLLCGGCICGCVVDCHDCGGCVNHIS
jgi:hypothetical protein